MKILALITLIICSINPAIARDEPNLSQQKIANYQFVEGDWFFVNQTLNPDFSYLVKNFYVNSKIAADGHMLKHSWNEFKADIGLDPANLPNLKTIKKMTKDFGLVLLTFDPEKSAMVTSFFSLGTSQWSINDAQPTINDGLIETSGESSDGFGPFQYYTRLEKLSDDKHEWVSQRLYESLGFWITIDSYVATRITQ